MPREAVSWRTPHNERVTSTTASEPDLPADGESLEARGIPLPTGAVFLAAAALLVLSFGGLREVATIIAPLFLAFTLVLAVDPMRRDMVDRGWPVWLATVLMLLLLYAVLGTVLVGIAVALTSLVNQLPTYQDEFEGLYDSVAQWLSGLGIETTSLEEVVSGIEPTAIVPYLQTFLGSLGSVGTMLLFILLGTLFLTIDLGDGRQRLQVIARQRPQLAASLREFSVRIRRYWVVSTVFGFAQAVLFVVLLMWLGVPLPLTWGVLAFVTSYIPNVGFLIGLVPATILGLLEGGPGTALAVIIGYSVINFVLMTLLLPKFAGDAVGLNVTTTFVSLVFWSIVVGPLGALLAIPLTLFTRAVLLDSHPRTQWIGSLLASSDLIRRRYLRAEYPVGRVPEPDD